MTTITATPAIDPADMVGDKIKCRLCGAAVHSIELHLRDDHKGVTKEMYQADHPGAPMFSPLAQRKLQEQAAARAAQAAAPAVTAIGMAGGSSSQAMYDVFALAPNSPGVINPRGKPVMCTVHTPDPANAALVPPIDPDYVFNVEVLKTIIMGMEMNIPIYLWGHSGTGKTALIKQVAARTGRPIVRVQHTAGMEEDQIVGGWRVRNGETFFEPGPLALAMMHGYTYIADEYDFGRPEATSTYQAVLEGDALVIKEADPKHRVIKPHPNFRFVATGNTNGQGDETGLYSGTSMQNAANIERFGIVQFMPWMEKEIEARVVSAKGRVPLVDAEKLVEFANRVREEYTGNKLSNPISSRSLVYAARLGNARRDYISGLRLAFINRLTTVDQEAVIQVAQRIFSAGRPASASPLAS